MIKVLIVEDEVAARENLMAILRKTAHDVSVAGYTESVAQTVRWLYANSAPDLIFMDIQLSDGSSFNIFSSLTVTAPIIFTTAFDQYAIEAFRVNSIDYLLKPIDERMVERALTKYRSFVPENIDSGLCRLSNMIRGGRFPSKILVPFKDRLIPVKVNEIVCFYSTGGRTCVYLENGSCYILQKSLDSLMTFLSPEQFIRANRQFIVAKDGISDMTLWHDNRLLINLKAEVPEHVFISKNRVSDFKNWILT